MITLFPLSRWSSVFLAQVCSLPQAKTFRFSANYRKVSTGSVAIGMTVCFYWLRSHYVSLCYEKPFSVYLIAILSLIIASGFVFVDYRNFPLLFSRLTRSTAIGVLLYLLIEPPDYTLVNENYTALTTYVDYGYWLAVSTGVVSLFRPSFLFPVAFYSISTRYLALRISGYDAPVLDMVYMIEMGQFLSLSACVISALQFAKQYAGKRAKILEIFDVRLLLLCLAFIAIGFHLGNYFWSGRQKLSLGPHFWTWVFENPTQNMMLVFLTKGALPFGAFPTITQQLFDGFAFAVVFSNLFVIISQLFAIVAPLRVRWLFMACLTYDLLHIGIYIIAGLLFWPWIWNNASIMVSIRGYRDQEIGWLPKFCCIVAIILGGSGNSRLAWLGGGNSARLAWFDTADVKAYTFQAESPDHKWVNVPSSFFLSHSYRVFLGFDFDMGLNKGHYQPSSLSAISDYARLKTSGLCPAPPLAFDEPPEKQEAVRERLEAFLSAHLDKMRRRAAEYGKYNFYFRLDTLPSNPWLFSEFNRIDLRQIGKLRLLTQSVCLRLVNGVVEEREIRRDETEFDVTSH